MSTENINETDAKKLFGDIFIFDRKTRKSKCILLKNGAICGNKITSSRPYNLKRHLKSNHPDFKDSFIENDPRIDNIQNEILNAWSEIVTINGRPFSMINDSGMQKLMDLLLSLNDKLTERKIQIDVPKIKECVINVSDKMKKQIMDETKDRLISLALDICTKCGRVILGINIQYMWNGRVVVRTLGMPRLKESHTANHVSEVVKNTLKSYNISVKQIYCVTTDNASYMLLCSDVPDELAEAALSIDDNNEPNLTDIQEEYFHRILKEAVDDFFGQELSCFVCGISYGVHTFQLAIGDTLKDSKDASNLIEKCRAIVKKLRAPSILRILKEKDLHMPLLDNVTRWNGKYTMVSKSFS